MAGNSTTAVITGISANALVTVGKFVAFAFSGSGAMLSEGIHSAADTTNQSLLLLGLKRSERGPDEAHPYGYGGERFFWGLVSALGIFFLGAGVTLYHGVHGVMHPEPATHGWITWAVLIGATVLEGGALVVAYRGMAADAAAAGVDTWTYAKEGRDPTMAAIVMEDGAAVLGLLMAVAGIGLEQITGEPLWDAAATCAIGLLLGVVAIILVKMNRRFILTPSIDASVQAEIREALEAEPSVESVTDLRGVILTLGRYKVNVDVDFKGQALADRILERSDLSEWSGRAQTDEGLRELLRGFAEDVVTELGSEMDHLEKTVRDSVPEVAHLDLEADVLEDESPASTEDT
ncbi:MAG: cation diffusion facilitator family transporter [Myxococcota bacterium]|nr:cation diffusion facilitator family transporter [Myxococcota bacterium]